jgi:hypothetical protein
MRSEVYVDENTCRSCSVIATDAFAILVAPFMSTLLLVFPPVMRSSR